MIYNNIELHNFEEVREIPDRQGVLLQRIPEDVRVQLREATQVQYLKPAGGEIRFVSEWEPVKITLASYQGLGKVLLYFGDFKAGEYVIYEEPTDIEIPVPMFLSNPAFKNESRRFHHNVRRLILSGGEIHLIHIEGRGIRPPVLEELPGLRYLAYGTSITHGINASNPNISYMRQTAWRLGADGINLGVAGSAYCEAALADYIASRNDWDFATFCVSVNMINQGVHVNEFYDKSSYMVCAAAASHPDKPVICIGLFPFFMDRGMRWPERYPVSTPEEYRNALKTVVENSKMNNLYYVEGAQLLTDMSGLSSDLLHPGDCGMIQIGENLSKFIKPILDTYSDSHKI